MKKYLLTLTLLFVFLFSYSSFGQWQQIWSDEFDGPTLNSANWTPEVNDLGGYNNELQYYTSRPENLRIENQALVIEARKENYLTRNYTSARIVSRGKKSFKYGKIEAKMKLPYGNGMWPAFWMMGNTGQWPACGEIDIMEMVGGNKCGWDCGDNKTHGYMWYSDNGDKSSGTIAPTLPSGKYADAYHLFAIEWDETSIKWFIDNVQFHSESITGAAKTEFHQPFYILLNLAVGGDWPGSPDASTVWPQRLYVDYVKVYQRSTCTVPAQPATISGNTTVTSGSSQTYSIASVSGATSYTWTLPSGWSGSSSSTSITATAASVGGTISVRANNSCGSSTTRTLAVSVSTCGLPAQPGVISGNTSVTAGSNNTYSIAPVNGATSYTWILPSGWSGSSSSTSITATAASVGGTISVRANNSCGSSPTRTLAVSVSTCGLPAQPGVISGSTSITAGSNNTYSIAPVNGATSYTWTLPSGWSGSSTSSSISATAGSTGGTISVVARNSCGASPTRTLAVTVAGSGFTRRIEAESYNYMSGIQTESCSEGGLNVGYFDAGDWLSYAVSIPSAGTYKVSYRVAATTTGRSLRLEKDNGMTNLGTVQIPNTNGWQNWITVSHNVTLPAGQYNIGITTSTGGLNINWLEITSNLTGGRLENEGSLNSKVLFYPNPAKNVLNLRNALEENTILEVFDLSGAQIKRMVLSKGAQAIDIKDLAPGGYFVKIKDKGTTKVERIYKE